MKIDLKKIIFLLLIMSSPTIVWSDPIALLANYSYTGSNSEVGGRTSNTSRVGQSYSLNFDRTLLHTKSMDLSGTVRGIKSLSQKDGGDSVESTSVTPSLSFGMNNDYFSVTSGYNTNEFPFIDTGKLTRATTWSNSFSTQPEDYPSLRLYYDESKNKSKDDISTSSADSLTESSGASTAYEWKSISGTYSYSRSVDQDFVAGSKVESPRHTGSLSYSGSFLDDRISMGANLGYTRSKFITSSILGTAVWVSEKRDLIKGLYGEGTVVPDEETKLIDSDKNDTVTNHLRPDELIHLNQTSRQLGFAMEKDERVDTIFVYVQTNIDADTINTSASDPGWNLYTSNDGITWTLYERTVNGQLDANLDYTFEVSSGVKFFKITIEADPGNAPSAKYFKVVNTKDSFALSDPINVTEIEASGSQFDRAVTKQEGRSKRLYGGIDVAFLVSDKINFTYNLTADKGENSSDDSPEVTDSNNLSQGMSFSYNASRYLNISTNYQFQSRNSKSSILPADRESGSTSYALSLSSNPLNTITLASSFTRGETTTNGVISTTSDSMNMSSFFNIYDGVDLGVSYLIQDSKSNSGSKNKTNSLSANFSLKPWSVFYLRLSGGHTNTETTTVKTEGDVVTRSSGESLRSAISFNPSEYFSVSMSQDFVPEYKRSISISSRLPGALQINLTYTISETAAATMGTNTYINLSDYLRIALLYNIRRSNNASNDQAQNYGIRVTLTR